MNDDNELRKQLVNLLLKRQAHMIFEDAVADFPLEHMNTRPPNCDYSFWQLLEHMRICQRDIIDYIKADDYAWPSFPEDYWPAETAVADPELWQKTIADFCDDRQELADLINDADIDLLAPLPNSGAHKHNIVREIHIIAAHNAYHTGEFGILRQIMGLW